MRAGLNILVAGGTQRRASWYIENWTGQIPVALEHGVVLGAAGNGRVSAATRADFAASAAAVLTSQDQAGLVYELGGSPFTLAEYAAELSAQSGQPVSYQDLPTYEYAAVLVGAGLPEAFADQVEDVAGRKGNGRSGHAPRPRRHVQAGAAGLDDLEGHVVDRMPDWFPLAAKDDVQRPRRDQVTPHDREGFWRKRAGDAAAVVRRAADSGLHLSLVVWSRRSASPRLDRQWLRPGS